MNSEEIRAFVSPEFKDNIQLEVHAELPSTNRSLSERVASIDHQSPLVLVADLQTDGVGRRGKHWLSQPGNISFSVLSHFDVPVGRLTGLSLVTGITVVEVLKKLAEIDGMLKWPNDVLVGDAKLAGLLIEVPRANSSSCSVVSGIGINHAAFADVIQIDQAVTSISELGAGDVSRECIIGELISRLLINQAVYSKEGLSPFMHRWELLDYLAGKEVRVMLGDRQEIGIASGISDTGELKVMVNGSMQHFNAGDVSVRKL